MAKCDRKLIKCMYFCKSDCKSPYIYIAVLTFDGKYAEFNLVDAAKKFGMTLVVKLRAFFMSFRIDNNTDIAFSEEFNADDNIVQYFNILRVHIGFRMSFLKLKKAIRGIANKHPYSVMTKREI